MSVSKHDVRLAHLAEQAHHLEVIEVSPTTFLVPSRTRKTHRHKISVKGDELSCCCPAQPPNEACGHIGRVVETVWPLIAIEWEAMRHREQAEKLLKERQKIFARLLKEREAAVVREFEAYRDEKLAA